MLKIKQRTKRFMVKMERRIVPKNAIVVTRVSTGVLSRYGLKEVLDCIRDAQVAGKLPSLRYSYGTLAPVPSIFPAEKGQLYLQPKSALAKVRAVLKQKYGGKYRVRLGAGL